MSTSLTESEVHSILNSRGLSPNELDALSWNSVNDIYYPSLCSDQNGPFVVETDYPSHIEHRWGGEGFRKTVVHRAVSVSRRIENQNIVVADQQLSTNFYHYYLPLQTGKETSEANGYKIHWLMNMYMC